MRTRGERRRVGQTRLVKTNDDKFDGHAPGRTVTCQRRDLYQRAGTQLTSGLRRDVSGCRQCVLSEVEDPGAPFGAREPMTEVDREPVG